MIVLVVLVVLVVLREKIEGRGGTREVELKWSVKSRGEK
jgi:hypothetical protein